MSEIRLDTREAERIAAKLGINMDRMGARIGFEIENKAKQKARRITGALMNSIYTVSKVGDGYGAASSGAKGKNPNIETAPHPMPSGKVLANVGPCVEYAEFVEFGSGAHDIYPKFKKALYWKGAKHPVKFVHHPGSAAKPFLVPAVEEVARKYNSGEAWEELIK